MILNQWKDFSTDAESYTQESFEQQIGDAFEAMRLDENQDIPNYIWTKHYVVVIKPNTHVIKDVSFVKVPRNPSALQ
ncbi:hypothetical protein F3157_22495 [Virgibacillus dakarensis]|uniref:Uncharacterized protein n=1 Tax=Lentibacillus populi TaxID=1827502 RepID=A0A9W5X5I1_9BACI|nr:hypothetical protein [Lentibacillus populi]MTW88346.1 hypothetical protein [Virgibacillus dakarensis]GGB44035.1 hypothetical protein GCM10011409_22050 [Lentibacillus populi]